MQTLGEFLLARRHRALMSQADAAADIGMSRGTLASWERGLTAPDAPRLRQLLELYGVPAEEWGAVLELAR